MKVFFWFWLLLLAPMGAFAQTAALTNFCVLGAKQAATSGSLSSNYLQGVIRQCTVTVFLTNTTNKATIYADANNTPLSNPFTANTNGLWLFYAAEGTGYDVKLSGGIPPNTYATPVTLTDMMAGGGPGLPLSSLQYNNAGGFGGTNTDYQATRANAITFGNIQATTATAWSCDGTNCTIVAPHTYVVGQLIYITGFDNECMTLTQEQGMPILSSGFSSSQFEISESDTNCTGSVSGATGSIFSDFEGFDVNAGIYGINLIATGFTDPSLVICAAYGKGNCPAGAVATVGIYGDNEIDLTSPIINIRPTAGQKAQVSLVGGQGSMQSSTDSGTSLTDSGALGSGIQITENGAQPITIQQNGASSIDIVAPSTAGNGVIVQSIFQIPGVLFSALPSCNTAQAGTSATVSDVNSGSWGQTVSSGTGTTSLPMTSLFCDGIKWTIAAE